MVDHGQEHLEVEKEQLMVKLKAVEVKMEEDQGFHQNLVEIVANCEEIKQLSPATKATIFMLKNLQQAIADTKQVVQKDEEFLFDVPEVVEEKKLEKGDV